MPHASVARPSHDRSLLRPHAERTEGPHHARGVRPAVRVHHGRHRQGRAVRTGLPEDQPQQQDTGDRRPRRPGRAADLALRIRRHPALSRREDRPLPAGGPARALGGIAVAVLADGRLRPDAGPGPPFPRLCADEPGRPRGAALRPGALSQRGRPTLRRARPPACRARLGCRRRLLDRRHGDLPLGPASSAPGAEP